MAVFCWWSLPWNPLFKVSAVGHLNFRSFGLKMHLFGKARAEHHVHQWVLLGAGAEHHWLLFGGLGGCFCTQTRELLVWVGFRWLLLANAFGPTATRWMRWRPSGTRGKRWRKCVKCSKCTLVECVKSVCVQNAFKMRSVCVRMRSRNALKTRRMRSPEQPSFGAISGAFRGKFARFSDTHTFYLATRAQTFAVPRSGWGCCVQLCENLVAGWHCKYIISYHIISYHIISSHTISYHIISYHLISSHIISYHIISYHITSHHVMSCHVMSCHVMSCHVMSCHVMSCHVMSCTCHVMSYICMSYYHRTCHVISHHIMS